MGKYLKILSKSEFEEDRESAWRNFENKAVPATTQNTQKLPSINQVSDLYIAAKPATNSPPRASTRLLLVPANVDMAPGTAKITEQLKSYNCVFEAARSNRLPEAPLPLTIGGQHHHIEATDLIEIETEWRQRAGRCQRDKRDLTMAEMVALDETKELLETVLACWSGDSWLELTVIEAQLDADYKVSVAATKLSAKAQRPKKIRMPGDTSQADLKSPQLKESPRPKNSEAAKNAEEKHE